MGQGTSPGRLRRRRPALSDDVEVEPMMDSHHREGSKINFVIVASILLVSGFTICLALLIKFRNLRESTLQSLLDAKGQLIMNAANDEMSEAISAMLSSVSLLKTTLGPGMPSIETNRKLGESFFEFHLRSESAAGLVESFTYVPIVKDADRTAYEALGCTVYNREDYEFREPGPNAEVTSEVRAKAPEYAPTLFRWPYDPEQQGVDLFAGFTSLRWAITRSLESGDWELSPPFLSPSNTQMYAFISPIFAESGAKNVTVGFLVAELKYEPFLFEKDVDIPWLAWYDENRGPSSLAVVNTMSKKDGFHVAYTTVKELDANVIGKAVYRNVSPIEVGNRRFVLVAKVSEPSSSFQLEQLVLFLLTLGLFATFFAVVVIAEVQNYRSSRLSKKMASIEEKRATDRALAASRVLSSISHDIRTPMNGIMGAINLLKDEPLSEQQHEYTDICMSCGDSLLHLINDYLDFNKLQSGTLALNPSPTSVQLLFRDVAAIYVLKSKEEGVTLDFFIADCVPEEVAIDPWRVKQVIINLITNSFKFTPRGGQILVEARILDAEATGPSSSERFLQFSVTDTGIGIAEEDIEGIFKPFRQLESGRRDFKGEGVGLGLSICRELVSGLMGGTIVCTSIPNVKTTFRFTVQLQATLSPPAIGYANDRFQLLDDALDTLSWSSCTSPMDRAAVNSCPVFLAVDDSSVNLRILVRYLETGFDGCTVLTAMNGREAVDAFSSHSDISVCFMDLNMPVMDGMESCRQIRLLEVEEGRAPCKIMALTASLLSPSEAEELWANGFDKMLFKPATKDEILSSVTSSSPPPSSSRRASNVC